MRNQYDRDLRPIADAALRNGVDLAPLNRRDRVAVMAALVIDDLIARGRGHDAIAVADILRQRSPRFVCVMASEPADPAWGALPTLDTPQRIGDIARMLREDKLDEIARRFEYLEARLADGGGDPVATAKEYAQLRPVVEAITAYRGVIQQQNEAEVLLRDPDMRALAEEELAALADRRAALEQSLRVALIPRDAADDRAAILEIRAGTGGEEAALFAGNLYRMYQRYAEARGWRFDLIESSESDLGGIREAVVNVGGQGVFARLKFESGVHRVQRVPETESGGRIHTSAATVAVLPEAEEVDVAIDPSELRIDTMRASGAGGQHVNTTDSAVRITHLPTGIVVTSSEKSQHQNRAIAMAVLRAKLYDQARLQADADRAADRRAQVGSGDRSERIRTYNFPQGRMTDHRINLTLYKLDQIIGGDLDEVIDALAADDQARKLAALDT